MVGSQTPMKRAKIAVMYSVAVFIVDIMNDRFSFIERFNQGTILTVVIGKESKAEFANSGNQL